MKNALCTFVTPAKAGVHDGHARHSYDARHRWAPAFAAVTIEQS